MTATSTAQPLPEPGHDGPWPQGVSRRATMTIGQVLEQVKPQFPQLTVSKLRFLENEGLITPERTDAGYRKYSPADVVRLRYILTAQRERFWPLRVIRDQLAALDAGEPAEDLGLLAASQAHAAAPTGERLTMADLAAACGLAESDIEAMTHAGLLRPDRSGRLHESDRGTVRLIARLAPHGIELRHLRPLVHEVSQELDLIEQATAVTRHRTSEHAREDATEAAAELASILGALHAALLRGGVRDRG